MTFEESWPDISRRLMRLVAAKRVPEAQQEDVIQETGIKLFRAWDRVDQDQGPWGLARTIAIHAIADNTAKHARAEFMGVVEIADDLDVERTAIARFRLASVRHALSELRTTDSRVLLAEVGAASPPRLGRSAMKMARSRARQRLRVLVEKPGSWLGLPYVSLRRHLGTHQRFLLGSRWVNPELIECVAAAAVALALTVTTPNIGFGITQPRHLADGSSENRSLTVDGSLIRADQGYAPRDRRRTQPSAPSEDAAQPPADEAGSSQGGGHQRVWEAHDKVWEEQDRQHERVWEAHDKVWEEQDRQHERVWEEHDRAWDEYDRQHERVWEEHDRAWREVHDALG